MDSPTPTHTGWMFQGIKLHTLLTYLMVRRQFAASRIMLFGLRRFALRLETADSGETEGFLM